MAKIICLVGESCAGKDTIFKSLIGGTNKLVPVTTYTTRPMRIGEKNGKEYYFTTKKRFNQLKNTGKIIESRTYNTVHGKWIYYTCIDNQIDIKSDNVYIMINTLDGAKKLMEEYPKKVMVLHICVNEESRLLRAFAREESGNRDFVEMCRRFVTDSKDFSPESFAKLGIEDNRIYNESIHDCVDHILKIIKSN
jgi:guanylate kinase